MWVFIKFEEIFFQVAETLVAGDFLLMEFGLNCDFGNQINKFAPNVIFGQNFCTLHLETCVQELHWDFLVGWELIEVFNVELIF